MTTEGFSNQCKLFLNWTNLCCTTGQSQWSSLVLVAARCSSLGKPCPAHNPGHDLPQGSPHCRPKSPHLCHSQEATVMEELLGRTALASMQFRNVFGHSSVRRVSSWLVHSLCTCVYSFILSSTPASIYSQMLIPVSHSLPERPCQFCWEHQLGHSTGMRVFLLSLSSSSISQPASLLTSDPDHNTLLNQWYLTWRSQSCWRKNRSGWAGMLSLGSRRALSMKEQKPVLT